MNARRVTPLTTLDDIEPAIRHYEALGFERIDTGTAGCVGMRAGKTSVILCRLDYLGRTFSPGAVVPLCNQTIPYVWVHSLARAKADLPTADLIAEALTEAGTREALLNSENGYLLLAETV